MATSPKRTYFYVSVQNYDNTNRHFLVPKQSLRADDDDVTVSRLRQQLTHRTQYHVTTTPRRKPSTAAADDDNGSPDPERTLQNMQSPGPDFTVAMKPSEYGESVTLTQGPPTLSRSVLTVCQYKADTRYKELVDIAPTLAPVRHRSGIVCHSTTTKKNFRTSVDYAPRIRPRKYESTEYVRPKCFVTAYVVCVDYTAHDDVRRYTTSVSLTPVGDHHSSVHGFRMRRSSDVIANDAASAAITSGADYAKANADVNMNVIVKRDVTAEPRLPQPTLMWSSGPADGYDDVTADERRMSHRTKMVVKTAPAHHVTDEDYAAYLTGYRSDVSANCLLLNGDDRGAHDVSDV